MYPEAIASRTSGTVHSTFVSEARSYQVSGVTAAPSSSVRPKQAVRSSDWSPIAAAAPTSGPTPIARSIGANAASTVPSRLTSALEMHGPLSGFRILDISTMIAAPFSAALLGDMGAEIIKVELPGSGDTLRHVAPMHADRSLYWSVLGRNKCSVTLDLRVPRGRDLFLELVKRCDALVENFRPGTLERWDLSYETLKSANPDVVLVRVSGYGQDGPYPH